MSRKQVASVIHRALLAARSHSSSSTAQKAAMTHGGILNNNSTVAHAKNDEREQQNVGRRGTKLRQNVFYSKGKDIDGRFRWVGSGIGRSRRARSRAFPRRMIFTFWTLKSERFHQRNNNTDFCTIFLPSISHDRLRVRCRGIHLWKQRKRFHGPGELWRHLERVENAKQRTKLRAGKPSRG